MFVQLIQQRQHTLMLLSQIPNPYVVPHQLNQLLSNRVVLDSVFRQPPCILHSYLINRRYGVNITIYIIQIYWPP